MVLNGYDMTFPIDSFSMGMRIEVCSYDAFVANADDWKQDFDLFIINTQCEIDPSDYVTGAQVVSAIQKFMAYGVKLLIYIGDAAVAIRKFNLDGTYTASSLTSTLGGLYDSSPKNFSAKTGVFVHSADYPYSEEMLRTECIPSDASMKPFYATDPTVIFPIQAYDSSLSLTANVVAYKPNTFVSISRCGTTGTSVDTIPYWKYVKTNVLIDTLLGKASKARIAFDMCNGKKVAAFGIDCDVTNDTNAIDTLRNAFPLDVPVEWGWVSANITDDVAGHHRSMRGINRHVSHTKTHYVTRTTITDEVHTIPLGQIVLLKRPYKALISSVKTTDDVTTFTQKTGEITRTAPAIGQYIINTVSDTGSVGQSWDGRLKFHASDVGKIVKITYTYNDEMGENLGSIKDLEEWGLMTTPCFYTTMGDHSVSANTYLQSEIDDTVIADNNAYPNYKRCWNALIKTQKKLPLPCGVTALYEWRYTMNDTSWLQQTKQNAKDVVVNPAINRCNLLEMPYLWYMHDFLISETYSGGLWTNKTAYNSDWVKASYELTRDNLADMYTWVINQIKLQNPYWMVRSEYVKRHRYINKYIDYDVQGENIKVINRGKDAIKGITFRMPLETTPTSVALSNGDKVYYTYADSMIIAWFDLAGGESVTLKVE